jgi:hypothetical protein
LTRKKRGYKKRFLFLVKSDKPYVVRKILAGKQVIFIEGYGIVGDVGNPYLRDSAILLSLDGIDVSYDRLNILGQG